MRLHLGRRSISATPIMKHSVPDYWASVRIWSVLLPDYVQRLICSWATHYLSAPGRMLWNPAVEGSGGGFASHPGDLVRWARALFEGRAMAGDYLGELLSSVPVGEADSGTRYGLAVAIHGDGPYGPSYGHGGWIPGYSSSLRYYPDLGVGVAFQINTDVGIVDGSTRLAEDMETRLVAIVAAALD